ncbi:hypothetical protein [Photobacterium sp. R1]
MENEQRKVEFLYQSIADTQQTIRATDVKLGFLFVLFLSPMIGFNEIFKVFNNLKEVSDMYYYASLFTATLWIFGLYCLLLAVKSIVNPSLEETNTSAKGRFYNGDLFHFNFFDNLVTFPIKPIVQPTDFTNQLPSNVNAVIDELSIEVYKLVYIRDVKIRRTAMCVNSAFLGLISGMTLWIFSLLKVGF